MKNLFKNIIALLILGIVVFIFRDSLEKSFFFLQDKYFPCTRVLTYSIDHFDDDFGISKEEFLEYIKDSGNIWGLVINKNLFEYKKEGGEIKISLIYDKRQASTDKLKNISESLDDKRGYYNNLKIQIDLLQKEYQRKKIIYENKVNNFRDSGSRYSSREVNELNNLQNELNNYVNNINSKVEELNKYASIFNIQAKNYNNIGDSLGEEFEEGLYRVDKNGKYIDIFQFEDSKKLKRVLLHEMGHSIGLLHSDEKESIMYRLNDSTNVIPTESDIDSLRKYCNIK